MPPSRFSLEGERIGRTLVATYEDQSDKQFHFLKCESCGAVDRKRRSYLFDSISKNRDVKCKNCGSKEETPPTPPEAPVHSDRADDNHVDFIEALRSCLGLEPELERRMYQHQARSKRSNKPTLQDA